MVVVTRENLLRFLGRANGITFDGRLVTNSLAYTGRLFSSLPWNKFPRMFSY